VATTGLTGPESKPRMLIIACGALAREIMAVKEANGLDHVDLQCLPASLHNRPAAIPEAVRQAARAARGRYQRIFVGYADCGTGGLLDRVLEEEGLERLPGPHCYAFFSGVEAFAAKAEQDMRAFFLTDFLARQFDTLVIEGLGIDRHPELKATYFAHYEKVVYLAQTRDPSLLGDARRAAGILGLPLEVRYTGYGDLATAIAAAGSATEGASR
jgi:hypothetical protein